MQIALQLLTHDTLAIKEVAARVGYSSQAAFTNAFKRWYGKSPSAVTRDGRTTSEPT